MSESFADKLREYREIKGWTQEDMYINTGISINNIKNWESGRNNPTIKTRKKLRDMFRTAGIESILPTAKEVDDLLNKDVYEVTAENIIDKDVL